MKKNSSVLSKLIISYVIIVAIPLIGFAAMYQWMRSNVEQYALAMNKEIIQNAHENINEVIEKITSAQLSLSGNNRMNEIAAYSKKGVKEDFECYLFQKELSGVLNSYKDIEHIYVYFPMMDVCVMETTSMYADDFFLRYYGMSEEESTAWKQKLLNVRYREQECMTIAEGEVSGESIEFIQKFPINGRKTNAVCVVSSQSNTLFAPLIRGDGNSEFIVVNHGNNVLYQTENSVWDVEEIQVMQQRENYHKNTILSEKILSDGWQLYSITDRDKVLAPVYQMRAVSLFLLVVYAVICWYTISTMSRRNYEPLQKLLHSISNSRNVSYEKNTNEYEWIQGVFTSTREEIKRQRTVMLEKFIQSLLKGKVGEAEWKEKCDKLGIKLDGEDFVVICFRIMEPERLRIVGGSDVDKESKLELSYFIINNIASELLEKRYKVISSAADDGIFCIVNFSGTEETDIISDIQVILEKVRELVKQYFDFGFLTVVSDECSFYHGIHEAYLQVLEGLEQHIFYQKDALILCHNLERNTKTDYYYPLEMEHNLIQCIVNGNFPESRQLVDELFHRNYEKIKGNQLLAKCFMSDFVATMIKAVGKVIPEFVLGGESDISVQMNRLLEADNIHMMRIDIIQLVECICNIMNAKSGSNTSDKVKAIIENCYQDSQLSVSFIAEKLDLHPVYLGTLFKEHTGEKLLDYIARYRIERSKVLMKNQAHDSLEDIGKAVGYDNVRTFTRVFKKYEGISPAQYKKSI